MFHVRFFIQSDDSMLAVIWAYFILTNIFHLADMVGIDWRVIPA